MLTVQDRERAKDVIVALIAEFREDFGDTHRLCEAFLYAHLEFARTQRGYLTTWPMIRTLHGCVIAQINQLIGQLLAEGVLEIEQISYGLKAFQFSLHPERRAIDLPDGFRSAILYAVCYVLGRAVSTVPAVRIADMLRHAKTGEELNIYLALPEEM